MSGKEGMKKYPIGIREEVVMRIHAGDSQCAISREYGISRYAVIYRHRNKYSVSVMCKFFGVSRSGYYDFVKRMGQPGNLHALGHIVEILETQAAPR